MEKVQHTHKKTYLQRISACVNCTAHQVPSGHELRDCGQLLVSLEGGDHAHDVRVGAEGLLGGVSKKGATSRVSPNKRI